LKELVDNLYYKNQLVMDNQDKLFNQIKQAAHQAEDQALQAWIKYGHVWMKLDQDLATKTVWKVAIAAIISVKFHWDTN
jgi:hypothetical protein